MTISRYVLMDREGNEDGPEFDHLNKAVEQAEKEDAAVIERTYTFDDSELVWTPDGSDTWPPEQSGND